MIEPIVRNITSDWQIIVFIICLVITVFVKAQFPVRFLYFQSLITSNKYLLLYGKEKDPIPRRFNIWLLIVQLLSFSMLVFLMLTKLTTEQYNFIDFVRILTIIAAFIGLKYFSEKIVAAIFEIENVFDSYNFHKLSFRNLIGICLLPLLLLVLFSPFYAKSALYATIFIFISLNLIALYITVKNHQKLMSGHLLYFILYLCAFEMAPYFIACKLIANSALLN